MRVPWTARRSNQTVLKEISPECSLEGLMLQLKLQYFCHLMGRVDLLEKILMVGKIMGRRRRGLQRMGWLDGITNSMVMSFRKLQEMVRVRRAWCAAVHGIARTTTNVCICTQEFFRKHASCRIFIQGRMETFDINFTYIHFMRKK